MAHQGPPEFEPNHEGHRRRVAIGLFIAATLGMMAVLSLPASQLIRAPLRLPQTIGSGLGRGAEIFGPLLGGLPFPLPQGGNDRPFGPAVTRSVQAARISAAPARLRIPLPPESEPPPPEPPAPPPLPNVPGGPGQHGPDGTAGGLHRVGRQDAAHCRRRHHHQRCHKRGDRMELGRVNRGQGMDHGRRMGRMTTAGHRWGRAHGHAPNHARGHERRAERHRPHH